MPFGLEEERRGLQGLGVSCVKFNQFRFGCEREPVARCEYFELRVGRNGNVRKKGQNIWTELDLHRFANRFHDQ